MNEDVETLAEVLAAHECEREWPWRCECGLKGIETTENEHLATALAPLLDQARRDAWDEGYDYARRNYYSGATPPNPYRAAADRSET